MAKKHWKEGAGAIVRQQIEALLAEPWRMTDGRLSQAQSEKQLMDLVWSIDLDCDAPSQSATEKVNALKVAGDFRELNRCYMLQGLNFEAEQEQRNMVRWTAMRKWAAEPSREESAAADMQRAAEQAREAEIDACALAIVAEENAAMLARARKQARKEIEARK